METISVGLLLPTSNIRPMSKEFQKSFKAAAEKILGTEGYELEVIPEMIGTGSTEQIDKSLDKFFSLHDVQLVAGIVSRYAIEGALGKFQKSKIPFVFNNLGEHMTPTKGFNDHVLVNSVHLWQQCWLLGNFAAKQFGGKGLAVCSMYDSGYAFLPAFQQGVNAAMPENEFEFRLLPMPQAGQLSDVAPLFQMEDLWGKDFVFSLFCGEEATLFLEGFQEAGLNSKTKLLGLPFLLEPGNVSFSGMSVYTPSFQLLKDGNDFVYKDIYGHLGGSFGSALANCAVKNGGQVNIESLRVELANGQLNRINTTHDNPCVIGPISIHRHEYESGNTLKSEKVYEEAFDPNEDRAFSQLRDGISANWMNPYLAI